MLLDESFIILLSLFVVICVKFGADILLRLQVLFLPVQGIR